MKRRGWLWGVGIVVVIAGAGLWFVRSIAGKDEAAYQEQLRLARSEGLPTTAAEYRATIPPAKPAENAAPFYRSLRGLVSRYRDDIATVDQELVFHPSATALADANAILSTNSSALKLIDQAAIRPRCWFDRPWEKGAGVLLPEYAEMKTAAKLLLLRGSVAAHRGDTKSALSEVMRVLVLAKHAGEEPHAIAGLVRESIYTMGLRSLSNWAFVHRDRPEYVRALREAVERFPKADLRLERSGELYMMLSTVELASTAEGRREFGLKEEDVSPLERWMPMLLNRTRAKAEIVRAHRAYYAALRRPAKERRALLDKAQEAIDRALFAFPTAASLYAKLSSGGFGEVERELVSAAKKQQYEALVRALSAKAIPSTISTKDLLSPFDGKPLSYRYDGKQIVIEVSGYEYESEPSLLKIPPDKMLKP
jgi:hypothetical protein